MTDKPSRAIQIGGTHYKGFKIEPITFAMANRYDAAAFSVLKYVSRHGSKGGPEDLRKAGHFVMFRLDELPEFPTIVTDAIPVDTYITENGIGALEAQILRDLHSWCKGQLRTLSHRQAAEWLVSRIERLSIIAYGDTE